MLADDFIEPASSPYSSPPLIQTEKDGSKRLCVDYRELNDLTIDAAQPLPVIQETLKEIGQAKVYSTIDLKSGNCQIPLHPNSRPSINTNTAPTLFERICEAQQRDPVVTQEVERSKGNYLNCVHWHIFYFM